VPILQKPLFKKALAKKTSQKRCGLGGFYIKGKEKSSDAKFKGTAD
jgi:hypothetical protein